MSQSTTSSQSTWRTYGSTRIDVDRSLANAEFAKAKVDCVLLQSRLRWGIHGPGSQDTGLLFLKIQFWQPKHCRLRFVNAEINFGLDEPVDGVRGPDILNVQPGQMCGQPWKEQVESSMEMNPHFEGGGFGVDIGKYARDKTTENDYRWSFTLQTHPDEKRYYTKLAWKWEDQDKGSSVSFERPIYVAVVVGHDKRALKIRTQLTGKLFSSLRNWKNLMVRPAQFEVTLMPKLSNTPEDLTTIIANLQQNIEEENRKQAPIGTVQYSDCYERTMLIRQQSYWTSEALFSTLMFLDKIETGKFIFAKDECLEPSHCVQRKAGTDRLAGQWAQCL